MDIALAFFIKYAIPNFKIFSSMHIEFYISYKALFTRRPIDQVLNSSHRKFCERYKIQYAYSRKYVK